MRPFFLLLGLQQQAPVGICGWWGYPFLGMQWMLIVTGLSLRTGFLLLSVATAECLFFAFPLNSFGCFFLAWACMHASCVSTHLLGSWSFTVQFISSSVLPTHMYGLTTQWLTDCNFSACIQTDNPALWGLGAGIAASAEYMECTGLWNKRPFSTLRNWFCDYVARWVLSLLCCSRKI